MDSIRTSEERAHGLVVVGREEPNGAFYIVLRNPGCRTVYLGPYDNRDVAKLEAACVRRFVAAVIREASETGEVSEGGTIAQNQSTVMIPSADLRRQCQAKQ